MVLAHLSLRDKNEPRIDPSTRRNQPPTPKPYKTQKATPTDDVKGSEGGGHREGGRQHGTRGASVACHHRSTGFCSDRSCRDDQTDCQADSEANCQTHCQTHATADLLSYVASHFSVRLHILWPIYAFIISHLPPSPSPHTAPRAAQHRVPRASPLIIRLLC